HTSVGQDAESCQSRLQFSGPKGLDDIGGAADQRATDENLWNGDDAGACVQRCAQPVTEVVLLQLCRVQVDAAEWNGQLLEQPPKRPAEFTPLQREHDDGSFGAADRCFE